MYIVDLTQKDMESAMIHKDRNRFTVNVSNELYSLFSPSSQLLMGIINIKLKIDLHIYFRYISICTDKFWLHGSEFSSVLPSGRGVQYGSLILRRRLQFRSQKVQSVLIFLSWQQSKCSS